MSDAEFLVNKLHTLWLTQTGSKLSTSILKTWWYFRGVVVLISEIFMSPNCRLLLGRNIWVLVLLIHFAQWRRSVIKFQIECSTWKVGPIWGGHKKIRRRGKTLHAHLHWASHITLLHTQLRPYISAYEKWGQPRARQYFFFGGGQGTFSPALHAIATECSYLSDLSMFALMQIAQSFKLAPYAGVELQPVLRTVLTPGEQVPVRFVDRN